MNVPAFITRLSFAQLMYPAILFVFAILVLLIFIFAAKSLTSEINRVFIVDVSENGFMIDRARYNIVAGKLGLPALRDESIETAEGASASTSAPEVAENPVPEVPLDKTMLSIAIYNATGISGLAAQFKIKLEGEGFVVGETGNAAAQSENTIALKAEKGRYGSLLTASLGSSFTIVDPLAEDSPFDCIITIGQE